MTRKVIALWGRAQSGKTSTLKIVHDTLLHMSHEVLFENTDDGRDVMKIFSINGLKVGLESQGDPGSRLGRSLQEFKKHDCTVIICATRSKGETQDLVRKLKSTYKISWRGQSSLSEEDQRHPSNKAIANLITKEVRAAIDC